MFSYFKLHHSRSMYTLRIAVAASVSVKKLRPSVT
jgi:hypothetical protein